MNIPEFTAEASLGKKQAYALAAVHTIEGGKITPASVVCTPIPGTACEQCTYCSAPGHCIHYIRCPWF